MVSLSILKTSDNIRYKARTAPETLSATALLPPGVGHGDQLYLPSAPGTLKSSAPPLSLIRILDIFTECPWKSTGMRIDIDTALGDSDMSKPVDKWDSSANTVRRRYHRALAKGGTGLRSRPLPNTPVSAQRLHRWTGHKRASMDQVWARNRDNSSLH